ncbi:TRAP transporter small permease [Falsirhodobacter sp. alg1]|uniref:TRAP transporter small permease n=1 Tax=Falsirhodobacter sp. alg1 TaxID=1472418 RepID=UPI0009EB9F66|nr:TRAP transporter small permease [Falsirhodobacter sp. alg1]
MPDPKPPKAVDPDLNAADPALDLSDDIDDSEYVSGLPGILGTLDLAISRIEAVLLACGVLLMALNTIANVVGRYAFGKSIFFSGELNRALIILITFAGISYAARYGRHIRMSAFSDAMPVRMRKVLMIVIAVITAALMLLLSWYALEYVLTQAKRGRVLPALQIPTWWIIVWVPLGFFLTGLQYALTAIKNVIHDGVWLSTNTPDGYAEQPEKDS